MRQSFIIRSEPFKFDFNPLFGEMEVGSGPLEPAWSQATNETLEFVDDSSLMSETLHPGRFCKIKYGQGGLLETAGRAYGLKAGVERLKRAQEINDHPLNRKFWRPPANDFERKYFAKGIISFNPHFACDKSHAGPQATAGKCFATIWIPPVVTSAKVSSRSFPSLLTIPMQDGMLNWSNIGAAEINYLLWTYCKSSQANLPGDDDRFPVKDTDQLPYRWICKIFGVFLSGPRGIHVATSQGTGFLLDAETLVTAAHVLYGFEPKQGKFMVPDCLIVLPGLRRGPKFPGDKAVLASGAFEVKKSDSGNQSAFYVPSEWITSYDPDNRRRPWAPEYDYGVVKLKGARTLMGGNPLADSWSGISKTIASIAAEDEKESAALARAVLVSKGASLCTSGYPADQNCWPVGTRKFEFAALQLPIDTDHNVMVTRGDFVKGASGSPVWFERRRPLLVKGGAVPRGPVMRVQHQLLGIVEGAFEFPLSTLVTYTTLITPKVLGRLKHPAFLSAL